MAAGEADPDKIISLPAIRDDRMTGSDAHTRDRWRWLDQVMADRELTPFAFSVAYVIASFVSRERGEAWPSQATIAERVGSSDRWVRKAVDQLASRWHLGVTAPDGRKRGNHYRLMLKGAAEVIGSNRNSSSGKVELHRNDRSCEVLDDRNSSSGRVELHRNDRSYDDGTYRNSSSGKEGVHRNDRSCEVLDDRNSSSGKVELHRNDRANLIGTIVPTIPMKETSESICSPQAALIESKATGAKPRTAKPKADDAAFDEFWMLYPRKVGKAEARKAYAVAIGKGHSHAAVMAGLRRYVTATTGKDAQYIKHPASWLRAERWSDEETKTAAARSVAGPVAFEIDGNPVPEANVIARLEGWYRRSEPWPPRWGDTPDKPGCPVPMRYRDQVGIPRPLQASHSHSQH